MNASKTYIDATVTADAIVVLDSTGSLYYLGGAFNFSGYSFNSSMVDFIPSISSYGGATTVTFLANGEVALTVNNTVPTGLPSWFALPLDVIFFGFPSTSVISSGVTQVTVPFAVIESGEVGNYSWFFVNSNGLYQFRVVDCGSTVSCGNPALASVVAGITSKLNASKTYIDATVTADAIVVLDSTGSLYYLGGAFNFSGYSFNSK